ncbi:Inactive transglutaminase fused to 7 transmembrane helices [Nitrosomonas cryotolerans]|uniref:Inactive transglutaminase fused to 7 transmembrane helices n=2 Tax=Nitrosomonas cryotolerans TaxID=44575 RepID=A0A1N6HE18_9PROT|nr:Inactive transglutaminase fused to 7 transmembrane helices [Nitrosomonas cryotolerans]SIO17957.1 Inactive transglutaminase fused to 7 transmembrane helices [Nitrosomonas cryotolerans ATCC 49181]
MHAKLRLYILVILIMTAGIGLILYKHLILGFPLLPDDKKLVWTIEAKIDFIAHGDPIIVSFALPPKNPNIIFMEEDFASPDYGFSELMSQAGRRAQWSKRNAIGTQTAYYRLSVYENDRVIAKTAPSDLPAAPEQPEFDEVFKTAAMTLLDQVRAKSANITIFTRELIQTLNSKSPSQNQRLLLNDHSSVDYKTNLVINLLALEGISARIVRGLYLEDGRRRQSLSNFIEVHDGERWIIFNQDSGDSGKPDDFLIWQRGGQSLLDVVGGEHSQVSFSIIKHVQSTRNLVIRESMNKQASLIDFSIYSLPIEQQNAFKMILLLPIGALIVVIIRLLIGIRTSGTFMPILIALALIQTTLVTGIIMFLIVVSIGLLIRSYLSHLNLLFVARISAVIIVVIGIMASISIISNKLGLSQALTITFFPMIILAWTIERMSILWEEDGAREVFIQGAGSLLTAIIAYLFMTNRIVEYMTFNFPELMLVNLALILILGQYTGYRLSELYRFKSLEQGNVSGKP